MLEDEYFRYDYIKDYFILKWNFEIRMSFIYILMFFSYVIYLGRSILFILKLIGVNSQEIVDIFFFYNYNIILWFGVGDGDSGDLGVGSLVVFRKGFIVGLGFMKL